MQMYITATFKNEINSVMMTGQRERERKKPDH